jgi:hypothetical protein
MRWHVPIHPTYASVKKSLDAIAGPAAARREQMPDKSYKIKP